MDGWMDGWVNGRYNEFVDELEGYYRHKRRDDFWRLLCARGLNAPLRDTTSPSPFGAAAATTSSSVVRSRRRRQLVGLGWVGCCSTRLPRGQH